MAMEYTRAAIHGLLQQDVQKMFKKAQYTRAAIHGLLQQEAVCIRFKISIQGRPFTAFYNCDMGYAQLFEVYKGGHSRPSTTEQLERISCTEYTRAAIHGLLQPIHQLPLGHVEYTRAAIHDLLQQEAYTAVWLLSIREQPFTVFCSQMFAQKEGLKVYESGDSRPSTTKNSDRNFPVKYTRATIHGLLQPVQTSYGHFLKEADGRACGIVFEYTKAAIHGLLQLKRVLIAISHKYTRAAIHGLLQQGAKARSKIIAYTKAAIRGLPRLIRPASKKACSTREGPFTTFYSSKADQAQKIFSIRERPFDTFHSSSRPGDYIQSIRERPFTVFHNGMVIEAMIMFSICECLQWAFHVAWKMFQATRPSRGATVASENLLVV